MSTAPTTPHLVRPTGPRGIDDPARLVDADPATTRSRGRARRLIAKAPPELGVLLVIAAALNLYGLGINGNANEYYSAAVRSMTQSWSGFFFGTFDSAGIMTVDKPPLALWVQALSARVFGFGTWSFLVPQALMGVAAVALVFDLTRRRFGRGAAFVAGLALATTPTAVAVFRHNNPDALLMLCSTLALWATVRAFESPQRTRWLVLAGVAVGLGFEAKMATALLVVPGIVAAWLYVRPLGLLRSIRQVGAFSVAAAGVGLAWPIAVWLIPAGNRPWISGTSDNSIWSLIFGYNGLGRVLGQSGGPGGGTGGPGGGGGGGVFGGDAGALRLLNESLGSQGGWLLGLAIGGGLAILVASRLHRRDGRTGWLIATGGGFAVSAVAFSFASGIFHPYYVSALAPFTAALVGAGLATMIGRTALGRSGVPSSELAEARLAASEPSHHAGGAHDARGADGTTRDAIDAIDVTVGTTPATRADVGATRGIVGPTGVGVGAAAVPDRLWSDDAGRTPEAWFGDEPAAGDRVSASAGSLSGAAHAAHEPTRLVRLVGGAGLIAGAVTEGIVLADADQFGWLAPILLVATILAGAALVLLSNRKVRLAAVGAAAALLLVAPAVWSAQTLGHATQGTFPTGGPESASGMGGPGGMRGGGRGGARGGMGGPPGGGTFTPPAGGFTPPTGAMGAPPTGGTMGTPPSSAGSAGSTGTGAAGAGTTGTTSATRGTRGGGGGGGMFSGDQTAVNEALAYAKANGGGTIIVSGQSGAAPAILSSDARVAGIGGFSGSESEVTVDWFAGRVASGDIRWVMTSGGGMGGRDSRTGSTTVMNAVSKTCAAVASIDGLYDCQGQATALRSAG